MIENYKLITIKAESFDTENDLLKFKFNDSNVYIIYDYYLNFKYTTDGINYKNINKSKKINNKIWKLLELLSFLLCNRNIYEIRGEGYPIALIAVFLKKIRKIKKIVYVSGDWLQDDNYIKLYAKILNNKIFPFLDLIICENAYKIINLDENIKKKRNEYWNRYIKRQVTEKNQFLIKKGDNNKVLNNTRSKIVFLGKVREDSGIWSILEEIENIKEIKYILEIIGPDTDELRKILALAAKKNYQSINYLGFIEREKYSDYLNGYVAGLNVLDGNSYSQNTIQAKIIDYINHSIPIIYKNNSKYISKIIEDNEIGIEINDNFLLRDALDKLNKYKSKYNYNYIRMFKR